MNILGRDNILLCLCCWCKEMFYVLHFELNVGLCRHCVFFGGVWYEVCAVKNELVEMYLKILFTKGNNKTRKLSKHGSETRNRLDRSHSTDVAKTAERYFV